MLGAARITEGVSPRRFTVSPAIGGKSTWDLDTDGDLVAALTSYGTAQYVLTSLGAFSFTFLAWGEGRLSDGKGGFVSGGLSVGGGDVLTLRLGYGRGTPFGVGGDQFGTSGGYAGIFATTTCTQATARAIAAGAAGPISNPERDSEYWSSGPIHGGAATGQDGTTSYPGLGGSQVAGGAKGSEAHGESAGNTNGSALQGGTGGAPTDGGANGWGYGGGGGGGYWGGGGGSGGGSNASTGGGGSNFLHASVISAFSERGGGRANGRRGAAGDDFSSKIVLF